MPSGSQEEISAEAWEALQLARGRSSSEEQFLQNMEELQAAIADREARVIGNLCVMGTGQALGSDKGILRLTLENHPDKFVAVLLDRNVKRLSPASSVKYSALSFSNIYDEVEVYDSILVHSAANGTTEIHNSYVHGATIRKGKISGASIG